MRSLLVVALLTGFSLQVLGCAVAQVGAAPSNEDATTYFDRGVELARKGDQDGAITEYRNALRLNPNHVNAHNNLGLALDAKGDQDGAITEYRNALRLNPNYVDAHNNLGVVFQSVGRRADAIAEFAEVNRLLPDTPANQSMLKRVRQHLHELE